MRRLLIRPGAIGDCILSLAALESLRAGYTEIWAPSAVMPLIDCADRVRAIASTGLDLLGLEGVEPPGALLDALASFDSIVSWYGANRPAFRAAMAPYPVTFFPALPPLGIKQWAAELFLEQAIAAGGVPRNAAPCIRRRAAKRDFVAIHPFSGSASKNWPLENFRAIAGLHKVEWCAGPEEELDGARRFGGLDEVADWLASARAYVGNDSGITHLAAAVGTPVVAVFGPSDADVWAPRGVHVRVVRHPNGAGPIAETPFLPVLDALESIL